MILFQRKVLGVLVKAPQTTVEISPPQKGTDPKLTPEEQLLRALYSYDKPEDYVDQASWLKLQKSDKVSSFVHKICMYNKYMCMLIRQQLYSLLTLHECLIL